MHIRKGRGIKRWRVRSFPQPCLLRRKLQAVRRFYYIHSLGYTTFILVKNVVGAVAVQLLKEPLLVFLQSVLCMEVSGSSISWLSVMMIVVQAKAPAAKLEVKSLPSAVGSTVSMNGSRWLVRMDSS